MEYAKAAEYPERKSGLMSVKKSSGMTVPRKMPIFSVLCGIPILAEAGKHRIGKGEKEGADSVKNSGRITLDRLSANHAAIYSECCAAGVRRNGISYPDNASADLAEKEIAEAVYLAGIHYQLHIRQRHERLLPVLAADQEDRDQICRTLYPSPCKSGGR